MTREERLENGLCTRCGKPVEDTNFHQCQSCRDKGAEARRRMYKLGQVNISEEMKQKDRERRKDLTKYRRENGLCYMCGKPKDREDRKACTECRERINKQRRDNCNYRASKGYCNRCGKYKVFGDEKRCPECRAKETSIQNRYREKNHDKYVNAHRLARNLQYAKNKEKGLCRCGRELIDGFKTCSKCRERVREYQRIAREKRGCLTKDQMQDRANKGLCFKCGGPVKKGLNNRMEKYRVCESCFDTATKNLENARNNINQNHIWRLENDILFKGGK